MYFRTPHQLSYFSDSFASGFSPLFSLVYVSASSHLLDDSEIEEILKQANDHNHELGVTGMLLYYERAFMQALEGTEETVRGLFARISQDPRHRSITPLLEEYIPERNFPDWSMGYYRLNRDEASRLPGYMSFAGMDEFLAYFQGSPEKSLQLLQSFRQSARR
jgi:hypothetical protein